MIPFTGRNQRANIQNPYQSSKTKALCVCSAGLLRSPSIAKYLSDKGYNTRACGASQEYALIPLSEALLHWADEIHVVKEQAFLIKAEVERAGLDTEVIVLDIPDEYEAYSPELMEAIHNSYL